MKGVQCASSAELLIKVSNAHRWIKKQFLHRQQSADHNLKPTNEEMRCTGGEEVFKDILLFFACYLN